MQVTHLGDQIAASIYDHSVGGELVIDASWAHKKYRGVDEFQPRASILSRSDEVTKL